MQYFNVQLEGLHYYNLIILSYLYFLLSLKRTQRVIGNNFPSTNHVPSLVTHCLGIQHSLLTCVQPLSRQFPFLLHICAVHLQGLQVCVGSRHPWIYCFLEVPRKDSVSLTSYLLAPLHTFVYRLPDILNIIAVSLWRSIFFLENGLGSIGLPLERHNVRIQPLHLDFKITVVVSSI